MNKELITRAFPMEFRVDEEKPGLITGRPVVYESKTDMYWFDEVIERGAISSETDMTDVLFFVNHDMSKIPLARSRRNNGNSTMQLTVDDQGLLITAELDVENNQEARALYHSIKRGDIDGMSFAFRIKKQRWEGDLEKHPTRYIMEFERIIEVSAVNLPAYKSTSISARSLDSDKEALDSARAELLDSRKSNEVEILRLRNKNLFM